MRYALLIYEDERQLAAASREEVERHIQAYAAVAREMADRNILRAGAPLRRTASATTVRIREQQTLTTDGPFAETKEQLGGFFIVDCRDLDEAIAVAVKLPATRIGSVEIRPIFDENAALVHT